MYLKLQPIGHVITDASQEELRHQSAVSKIIVDGKFVRALEGLEDFSHIYVLFWLHNRSRSSGALKVHPRGRPDIAKVGIFATRSPHRPNPIGLTLVRLLGKRGRVLTVKGLDAYNGTPVFDLKPHDRWDSVSRLRVPQWWRRLDRESKRARRVSCGSRRSHLSGRLGSRT